jgi:quercetin dioxygenase-like cupin family protein
MLPSLPAPAADLTAAEEVEDQAAEEGDGPVVPRAEPLEIWRSLDEPDDEPDESRHPPEASHSGCAWARLHSAVASPPWHSFDVSHVAERLAAGNGGYEVVHESPGIQIGVYVLVAPEPDRQQPHEWDELYVVLQGRGTLQVEGEDITLAEGGAAFVKAGAGHRFVGYEGLSLLVVFDKSQTAS